MILAVCRMSSQSTRSVRMRTMSKKSLGGIESGQGQSMVSHRGGPKSRHGQSSGILPERANGGPKSMIDGKYMHRKQ